MRSRLEAGGIATDMAIKIASGTAPMWTSALRARGVEGVEKIQMIVRRVRELRRARIERRVATFRKGWVEKRVNSMQDHVRIGKENNNYAWSGAL